MHWEKNPVYLNPHLCLFTAGPLISTLCLSSTELLWHRETALRPAGQGGACRVLPADTLEGFHCRPWLVATAREGRWCDRTAVCLLAPTSPLPWVTLFPGLPGTLPSALRTHHPASHAHRFGHWMKFCQWDEADTFQGVSEENHPSCPSCFLECRHDSHPGAAPWTRRPRWGRPSTTETGKTASRFTCTHVLTPGPFTWE